MLENCLIRFKKEKLQKLREEKKKKKEELDKKRENLKDRNTQAQSEEFNEFKESVNEIKELDKQIDILDLTVDKFWDEVFSTYDWIIEKEEEKLILDGTQLKTDSVDLKNRIDDLLDRFIKLIEHGYSVHILRGKPLKIKSKALERMFEKMKLNNELLIITVIGEQSSGKSSLLNALFGCDFRTSAGRCTVGIYMNFVRYKVNECLVILHFIYDL